MALASAWPSTLASSRRRRAGTVILRNSGVGCSPQYKRKACVKRAQWEQSKTLDRCRTVSTTVWTTRMQAGQQIHALITFQLFLNPPETKLYSQRPCGQALAAPDLCSPQTC
jgi:hypothetical protein